MSVCSGIGILCLDSSECEMPKRAAPYTPTPSMFDVGICVALQLVAPEVVCSDCMKCHVGLYELSPPDFLRPGKGLKI